MRGLGADLRGRRVAAGAGGAATAAAVQGAGGELRDGGLEGLPVGFIFGLGDCREMAFAAIFLVFFFPWCLQADGLSSEDVVTAGRLPLQLFLVLFSP